MAEAAQQTQTLSLQISEGLRKRLDVAFAVEKWSVSERRGCELLGVERSSYAISAMIISGLCGWSRTRIRT